MRGAPAGEEEARVRNSAWSACRRERPSGRFTAWWITCLQRIF